MIIRGHVQKRVHGKNNTIHVFLNAEGRKEGRKNTTAAEERIRAEAWRHSRLHKSIPDSRQPPVPTAPIGTREFADLNYFFQSTAGLHKKVQKKKQPNKK